MMAVLNFKASTTQSPQIDVENRIIRDVIMAQVGDAKGWGMYVEQEFIDAAVAYSNKKLKEGVLCEFGHNYNGIGKQLGRFKNVRVVGDKMIGDFHGFKAADKSPIYPKMGEWFMDMAKEDKKAVMCSIKFLEGGYYQRDTNGVKIKIWYYNDNGSWVSSVKEYGKIYVEFKELRGCDIVSKGALTNKLFDSSTLYQQFQDLVNHDDFRQMLEMHHEEMPQLIQFFTDKVDNSMFQKMKKFFTGESNSKTSINPKSKDMSTETTDKKTDEPIEFSPAETAILDQVKALSSKVEAIENKTKAPVEEKPSEDPVEFSAAEQAILDAVKGLSSRVETLEKNPAAEEIGGPTETTDLSNGTKSWMKIGIHDRARKMGFGK